MSRAHAEIGRLTRRLETHLDAIDHGAELDPERRQDVLACPYGLHALLELHFVQEAESYFALVAEWMTNGLEGGRCGRGWGRALVAPDRALTRIRRAA
jgi:hypothetical protein